MKAFITPAAHEDIVRQYRYLLMEQDSPLAAERFLRAARTAIREACKRPGLGTTVQLKNPQLVGLRSWLIDGFPSIRIYYLISGPTFRVVRVLHGKRDLRAILESEPEG